MTQPEPFEDRLRAYLGTRSRAAGNPAAVERTLATVFDRTPQAHARRLVTAMVIAAIAALVVATPITVFLVHRAAHNAPAPVVRPSPGPSPRATVPLSGVPGVPAVNPKTRTLYVPIDCPTSACATDGTVVDVINAATCNAQVASGCRVVAEATVDAAPQAVAIDEATDTIYVPDRNGTTTVLNGAQCNAMVTRGCGTPVATIPVGGTAAAFNPNTKTLYVSDPEGGVRVIDAATCNSGTTSGCAQPGRVIRDNNAPQGVDIDFATDTVYTANDGGENGTTAFDGDATTESSGPSTVSVIDGATCNGTVGTGCDSTPPIVTVGSGAVSVAVDQTTNTVYVSNINDGTVSVIDGAHCNSANIAGCARTPFAVPTGGWAAGVAVDDSLHTVFTVNENDNTLSAISTTTCNGATTSGCPKVARNSQSGADQGTGFNAFPQSVTIDAQTNTAYVTSGDTSNVLAVLSVSACNAAETSGCRPEIPSVTEPGSSVSIDPATDTIYASNDIQSDIDVLNGATCDAMERSGCTPLAKIAMPDATAEMGAIDSSTHTLYASDSFDATVSVIDIATCNATDTSGCAEQPRTMRVGPEPGTPVLNETTQTLYLPVGTSADEVAVLNAATCNAEVSTGCDQTPGIVHVGENTQALGISVRYDTIYAPSVGIPAASGDTVSVINGATCNGTDHTGCGAVTATVTVGPGPYGVTVDDATSTVYVANNQNGFAPGTVSMINAAACNGTHTAGCAGPFLSVGVGRSPRLVVLDPITDIVYITDHGGADVSELSGATCNAVATAGCSTAVTIHAVGAQPTGLAVNEDSDAVYVTTFLVNAALSIFSGQA
jgi:DNA-binding beta-propeller fold protein YncE